MPKFLDDIIAVGGSKVGVGTTTPTAPLHIDGATNSEVLKIEADSNPYIRWVENGTNVGFLQFLGDHAYLSNMSNGSFFFRTNNTTQMTLDSGGKLGIGTTSPGSKLDVYDSQNPASGDIITSKVYSNGNVAANGNTRTGLDVETNRRGWYNSDATSGNFKISLSNSGARIGVSNLIGLKSLATLDVNNVYSGVSAQGSLTALYGKVTTTFTTGSSPVANAYGLRIDAPEVAANSEISTYYGAYIDGGSVSGTLTNKYALVTEANAGNVGIGTTDPSYAKLQVAGTTLFQGASQIQGDLSLRGNVADLNKAASAFLTTKTRNTSGSELTLEYDYVKSFNATSGGDITFAGDIRLPNSGQLFLWNDHDANYLMYDKWVASASAGMTIQNSSTAGEIYLKSGNALTLTLDDSQNATFGGNIIAGGAVYPATNAAASLGLSDKQWAGLDLSSSSAITWGNGDAEIIEGETNNYSLTFKTYDGSANSAALRLDGDNTATFTAAVNLTGGALSISGDGSNAVTFTESSAGIMTIAAPDDIILDAVSDIVLDAAGNDIRLKAAGTAFGTFTKSGNHFLITSNVQDGDIKFYGNDGGNSVTALTLDMSDAGTAIFNHDIKLSDSSRAYFGNSLDVSMFHDGTNSYIDNNNGDFYIRNYADDKDIIFQSDDNNGGVATYFYLDGSIDNSNLYTVFPDNAIVTLGTGYDLQLFHDGTNSYMVNSTGSLTIRNVSSDSDILFIGRDGGSNITALTLDMSDAGTAIFSNGVYIPNHILHVGDGNTKFGFPSDDTFEVVTGGTTRLTLNNTSATFAGNVTVESLMGFGTAKSPSSVGRTASTDEGIFWHTNNDYAIYRTSGNWSSPNYQQLKLQWATGIEIDGNGTTYGKTGINFLNGNIQMDGTQILDVSRNLLNINNATIAGTVTAGTTFIADATSATNGNPGTDNVWVSGYGIIGNRDQMYITNHGNKLVFGVGGVHNQFNKLVINSATSAFSNNITSTGTITGTTLTGTSLDINGSADISGDLVITGNIKNNIENGTLDFYGGTDTTNDAHIRLHGNNTQWGSLYMDFGYDAANSKFIVNQGGTERFKIQNNIAYFSGNADISGTLITGTTEITKQTDTTSTTGTTFLELDHNVGGDIDQQQTFIDFKFTDGNINFTPQVRIGAQVGPDGNANTTEKEGAGSFVVFTADGLSNTGTLNESMRVSYNGNATFAGDIYVNGGDVRSTATGTSIWNTYNGTEYWGGKTNVDYWLCNTSCRAPIFYDSADTSYYLDPANTGKSLCVAGEIEGTSLDINGAADISGDLTGCAYKGDVIASAYLDSDTMHLGVAQNISNHKRFNDSIYAKFGAGDDMEIYHDGTDNHIDSALALNIATDTSGVQVTIGHTTSEVLIKQNLTINGNLTTKGDVIIENTTNLAIRDTIITLNDGTSGTQGTDSSDIGIMMQRHGNNKFFGYDESEDEFIMVESTEDVSGAVSGVQMGTTQTLHANIRAYDSIKIGETVNEALSVFPASTTTTLGTSNTLVPTQNAVKTYADTKAADNAVVKLTGNQTIAGNKTFSGTITHNGLVQTAGTAIDQLSTFDMSFQLAANTWTDTGVDGTDLLSGTYAMQVYVEDFNAGGGHYYEFYSATISWFTSGTNSTNHDEIVMHRAGHASNASHLQFRTLRASASDTHDLMLQVKQNFAHNTALTGANGKIMVIKFRKLI